MREKGGVMGIDLSEEQWLREERASIAQRIGEGLAELDRGEGLTSEEALAQLEVMKTAWREKQRR